MKHIAIASEENLLKQINLKKLSIPSKPIQDLTRRFVSKKTTFGTSLASNNFDKSPSVVEKSFRFLKDPKVVASSLFVQKPERKRAILFLMTLCLLVYATLEYRIRYELKKAKQTFINQVGKPTQRPTLNWVFQCFEGIDLLYQEQEMIMVLNRKPRQQKILDLLGKEYWAFYS